MYALNEALARERVRERHQQARRTRLSGELAAANRWHYLAARAHAAHLRHARRAHRAGQASAVAEAR